MEKKKKSRFESRFSYIIVTIKLLREKHVIKQRKKKDEEEEEANLFR